jgi:hypothetical protein
LDSRQRRRKIMRARKRRPKDMPTQREIVGNLFVFVGCGGVFVGVGVAGIIVNGVVEAEGVAICEDVDSIVDVVGTWELMVIDVKRLGVGDGEEEVVDMVVCLEIFGIRVVVEMVVEFGGRRLCKVTKPCQQVFGESAL